MVQFRRRPATAEVELVSRGVRRAGVRESELFLVLLVLVLGCCVVGLLVLVCIGGGIIFRCLVGGHGGI